MDTAIDNVFPPFRPSLSIVSTFVWKRILQFSLSNIKNFVGVIRNMKINVMAHIESPKVTHINSERVTLSIGFSGFTVLQRAA